MSADGHDVRDHAALSRCQGNVRWVTIMRNGHMLRARHRAYNSQKGTRE